MLMRGRHDGYDVRGECVVDFPRQEGWKGKVNATEHAKAARIERG
eukprot:gene12626-7605_t